VDVELQALMAHQAEQDAGLAAVLGRYSRVREAEVADDERRQALREQRRTAAGLPLRATKQQQQLRRSSRGSKGER
jgi:hypothetical protein